MVVRRPRAVRGVDSLNQRVVTAPPSGATFAEFAAPYLEGDCPLTAKEISFAWCRTDNEPPPKSSVRFRAIVDNPDGQTGPEFYPIGWYYKNLFNALSVKDRNEQRILRKVYDAIPSHPYAYAIFPYLSDELGLTLLLAKTRITDVFGANYISRTSAGEGIEIAGYNIFGMQEIDGPGSHYHYPNLAERHLRMAHVLNEYKRMYGRFPPLYGDYLQALKAMSANRRRS